MLGALSIALGYLLGSIPFGYLIVRWQRGTDVRTTGSKSTGATNVMRNLGIGGFLSTFVLDAGKGYAAVLIASKVTGDDSRWVSAAAVAAIAGHIFPVWLEFRGGKGVATGMGAFAALAPLPMGLCLVLFAILVALWRYISLGSIISIAIFPVAVYFIDHPPVPLLLGTTAGATLVVVKHHANIQRLLNGTESKIGTKLSDNTDSSAARNSSPRAPHQ